MFIYFIRSFFIHFDYLYRFLLLRDAHLLVQGAELIVGDRREEAHYLVQHLVREFEVVLGLAIIVIIILIIALLLLIIMIVLILILIPIYTNRPC